MTVADLMAEFPLRSEWICDGVHRKVVGYSRGLLMMATGAAGTETITYVTLPVARGCRLVVRRGL